MDLSKLVAVSGKPGLYKMVTNKDSGLIVEDLDTGKKRFVSGRKHQFTPLESISIYTWEDAVELATVFGKMLENIETNPIPGPKDSADSLRSYFTEILPDHDTERVYVNDIQKLIKWFNFLNERGVITTETKSEEEE